jgi:hypothetical protein
VSFSPEKLLRMHWGVPDKLLVKFHNRLGSGWYALKRQHSRLATEMAVLMDAV